MYMYMCTVHVQFLPYTCTCTFRAESFPSLTVLARPVPGSQGHYRHSFRHRQNDQTNHEPQLRMISAHVAHLLVTAQYKQAGLLCAIQ